MSTGESKIVLALYVDDIVLVGDNLDMIRDIKDAFKDRFQMKDLGELQHYLGMRVTRTADAMTIDQTQYAKDVVKKFDRWIPKSARKYKKNVPFYRDTKLTRNEKMTGAQIRYKNKFPYQQVMGSLLYLAINTRPDIAYAVNVFCRFNANPKYGACRAAARLLLYVKVTVDYGIRYSGHQLNLEAYSDSDWGGDLDTRRSTTGNCVFMANGPISWVSRLQTTLCRQKVGNSIGQ